MKAKEMSSMTKEEIEDKVIELKQELAKERASIASGTRSEKPSKIKNIKKDIARLLTVMNTKEIK